MKSLEQIQWDLEYEGFKLVGGCERGVWLSSRTFQRSEENGMKALIIVNVFNQDGDEEIEAEEEGLEEELLPVELRLKTSIYSYHVTLTNFADFYERAYIIEKLEQKYPQAILDLINERKLKVPQWLQKELEERRVKE